MSPLASPVVFHKIRTYYILPPGFSIATPTLYSASLSGYPKGFVFYEMDDEAENCRFKRATFHFALRKTHFPSTSSITLLRSRYFFVWPQTCWQPFHERSHEILTKFQMHSVTHPKCESLGPKWSSSFPSLTREPALFQSAKPVFLKSATLKWLDFASQNSPAKYWQLNSRSGNLHILKLPSLKKKPTYLNSQRTPICPNWVDAGQAVLIYTYPHRYTLFSCCNDRYSKML